MLLFLLFSYFFIFALGTSVTTNSSFELENIHEIQNVTEKTPFDDQMEISNDIIPAFDELEFIKSYFFETLRESSLNPEVFIEAFEKFKNAGGVFGDPHFVLPISDNFSICFDWIKNETNEFDNIILKDDHFVNARMTSYLNDSTNQKSSVYVTELAFVVPMYKITILFQSMKVVIKFQNKKSVLSEDFSLEKGSVFSYNGIKIEVERSRGGSHFLLVRIIDTQYRVVIRTKSIHPHVNLYFSSISGPLKNSNTVIDGIVGRFYKHPVSIKKQEEGKATLYIGQQEVIAHRHKLNSHSKFNGLVNYCWLMNKSSLGFFKKSANQYVVDTISSRPKFYF